MQKFTSTRVRILYWVLLPVIAGLGLSWGSAWILLNQQTESEIYAAIGREVEELQGLAANGADPVSGQKFESARALLENYMGSHVANENEVIIATVDGEPFLRSAADSPVELDTDSSFLDLAASTQPLVARYQTAAGEVIFGSMPVSSSRDSGSLIVVYFADIYKSQNLSFVRDLGLISIGSVMLAVALGWFAAGRVLLPIRQLGRTARRISDQNLDERIPISQRQASSELGGIASTFNSMMDRIQLGFQSQRQFVDDAGHELRTPLTIIRGNLELHKKSLSKPSPQLDIAIDELNRMSVLVKDLQTLTSSSSPEFLHAAPFELGELLDELLVKAESLGDRQWEQGDRPEAQFYGDRGRITQAALQLIENAAKHTKSGDRIKISGLVSSDGYSVVIEDSGPGIPQKERDAIRERFVRGSAVAPDTPGAGLGLAVVSAIAEAHGGQLFLDDSPLGGLRARVWIPTSRTAGEGE